MGELKITITEDSSTKKTIKCFCNRCNIEINHNVIKSVLEEWEEEDRYGPDGYTDFQTIKCNGCGRISFRELKYCSEYRDEESDGTYEELYPESHQNHHEKIKTINLPYNLENVYDETVSCYNKKMRIMCATGIRAMLDGICNEQGIKKGTIEKKQNDGKIANTISSKLDGKINGMNEKGIITKSQANALHELRFLGNKAIHELDEPSLSDLDLAFDIVEHVLVDIYDLPVKSKKLEMRRKK